MGGDKKGLVCFDCGWEGEGVWCGGGGMLMSLLGAKERRSNCKFSSSRTICGGKIGSLANLGGEDAFV